MQLRATFQRAYHARFLRYVSEPRTHTGSSTACGPVHSYQTVAVPLHPRGAPGAQISTSQHIENMQDRRGPRNSLKR